MQFGGLLVGLGNPGVQYVSTRHNCGFMAIDQTLLELEKKNARIEQLSGTKFNCQLWRVHLSGFDPWLFSTPQTFMNASGDSVQPLMAWYKILPSQLFVIHDELDLEPGRIQLKKGGGCAGHNGLKSISGRLSTTDFYRIRIGIGKPQEHGNIISWVLSRFGEDSEQMENAFLKTAEAFLSILDIGPERAANSINMRPKKTPLPLANDTKIG